MDRYRIGFCVVEDKLYLSLSWKGHTKYFKIPRAAEKLIRKIVND